MPDSIERARTRPDRAVILYRRGPGDEPCTLYDLKEFEEHGGHIVTILDKEAHKKLQ